MKLQGGVTHSAESLINYFEYNIQQENNINALDSGIFTLVKTHIHTS